MCIEILQKCHKIKLGTLFKNFRIIKFLFGNRDKNPFLKKKNLVQKMILLVHSGKCNWSKIIVCLFLWVKTLSKNC